MASASSSRSETATPFGGSYSAMDRIVLRALCKGSTPQRVWFDLDMDRRCGLRETVPSLEAIAIVANRHAVMIAEMRKAAARGIT